MSTQTATAPTTRLEPHFPIQLKLAAAWASFMFLYLNVDLLGLFRPGVVEGILQGKVHTFDITETFMTSALAASALPIMMIALSTRLPARANRLTNLVVATLLIPWMGFNVTGGEWPVYHGLGFALELVLLVCILRTAWTWPLTTAIPSLNE